MKVIYKITSPSSKIYIGQASNFINRVKRYKILACKSQKKLFNSLVKYGVKSHTFEIIQIFPNDVDQYVLDNYEKFFISQYREAGKELLNLTDGGRGVVGYVFTEDVRLKLKLAKLGKNKSVETKNKMSLYHKNRPLEHKFNNIQSIRKPVIQYSINGEFIKEWPSLKSVPKHFGFVRGCLNSSQYQAGGYFWEYAHKKSDDIVNKLYHLSEVAKVKEDERRKRISESSKNKNKGSPYKLPVFSQPCV